LNVIALGILQKPLSETIEAFTRLMNGVLKTRLSWLWHPVRWMLTDSFHSEASMENALQDLFGRDTVMFGHLNYHGKQYIKVAVTATEASESSCYIFTNYSPSHFDKYVKWGVGSRSYDWANPFPDHVAQPKLWEV
jgi:hypothetical protein